MTHLKASSRPRRSSQNCQQSFLFFRTELFAHVVNDAAIEFPSEDDYPLDPLAKDLITALLQQSPQDRLGSAGPQEVKEHPYLGDLDWNSLLRYKVILNFQPKSEANHGAIIFAAPLAVKLKAMFIYTFTLCRPNSFHDWRTKKTRATSTLEQIATITNSMTPTRTTRQSCPRSTLVAIFRNFSLINALILF